MGGNQSSLLLLLGCEGNPKVVLVLMAAVMAKSEQSC